MTKWFIFSNNLVFFNKVAHEHMRQKYFKLINGMSYKLNKPNQT